VLNPNDLMPAVLILVMLLNRHRRGKAVCLILMMFGIHAELSAWLYLDECFYYFFAIIADILLIVLLGFMFRDFQPLYIKHVGWLLVAMCVLNIIGGGLYYAGDKGYFYAGAMFLLNCALIIRLLIMTRRDNDGASGVTGSLQPYSEGVFHREGVGP